MDDRMEMMQPGEMVMMGYGEERMELEVVCMG